jgi:hypothetical protein
MRPPWQAAALTLRMGTGTAVVRIGRGVVTTTGRSVVAGVGGSVGGTGGSVGDTDSVGSTPGSVVVAGAASVVVSGPGGGGEGGGDGGTSAGVKIKPGSREDLD